MTTDDEARRQLVERWAELRAQSRRYALYGRISLTIGMLCLLYSLGLWLGRLVFCSCR